MSYKPVYGELQILAPIPCVSCSCYNDETRDLVILLVHVFVTLSRLLGPGGIRSVVAESVLVKQQLLILNRSRERAPRLRASDRFVAGLCTLFVQPARVIRSAIVLKPSTLLNFHQARSLPNIASGLKTQWLYGLGDEARDAAGMRPSSSPGCTFSFRRVLESLDSGVRICVRKSCRNLQKSARIA
jgi:hypothetical protein